MITKTFSFFISSLCVLLSACTSPIKIPPPLTPDQVPQNTFDKNGSACNWSCQRVLSRQESLDHFPPPQAEPQIIQVSTPYTALIWNIYKGRMASFAPEYARLAKNSQLILIQEALDQAPVISPLHKDPSLDWWMLSTFLTKEGAKTGVATGSVFTSTRHQAFRTKELEPFVKSPKAALLTYYPIESSTSQTLLIVNIHGINWKGESALLNQMLAIESALATHKGPVVFGGDFNTKNTQREFIVRTICERNNLIEVPWANQKAGKILDHIYTRGLNIINATYDWSSLGSDHPSMHLEFSILPHLS